jgi:hypothetical protein
LILRGTSQTVTMIDIMTPPKIYPYKKMFVY